MDRIRVLVCEPNKTAYPGQLENSHTAYGKLVGGEYTAELMDKNTVIVYNKAMTENGDKPNRIVGHLTICGTFFLASVSDDDMYKSMSNEQMEYYYNELGKAMRTTAQDCKTNTVYKSIGKDIAYINNLNFYIEESGTDFRRIAASYKTEDKTEAKELLKAMHSIFKETYGTESVDDIAASGDGIVHLPAVLKSEKTGDIQLGLVLVNTDCEGECLCTTHITSRGIAVPYDLDLDKQSIKEMRSIEPYGYWYTPTYEGDTYMRLNMPDDVREIIDYATGNNEQTQGMEMQGM